MGPYYSPGDVVVVAAGAEELAPLAPSPTIRQGGWVGGLKLYVVACAFGYCVSFLA